MYLVQPEASRAPNNIIAPPTKAVSGITPVAEPHVPDIMTEMHGRTSSCPSPVGHLVDKAR